MRHFVRGIGFLVLGLVGLASGLGWVIFLVKGMYWWCGLCVVVYLADWVACRVVIRKWRGGYHG